MAQAVVEEQHPSIVHGGPGVAIDTDLLDVVSEIPILDVPEKLRHVQDPKLRREQYIDWIERRIERGVEPPVSATSVAVENDDWRDLTLLIADGKEISEGKLLPAETPLIQELRVTLATWSGLPLANKRAFRAGAAHLRGVKVGLRALNGPDAQDWERRGGTLNKYREYPARFECSLVDGRRLLDLYGWRIAARRSRWWLYEVGGPLESDLALWLDEQAQLLSNADLAARARAICPRAFDDKETPEPASKRRGR